ncbi:MAG: glycosyltransferase family 39 protein [Ruminococcus sp.]|nr:glycosyltransferase family 39 protein [Ruminococcus sp.]
MNGKKLARVLNRTFNIIFLISFGCMFFTIIFMGYGNKNNKYSEIERPWIVLTFLLLLVIFTAVYIFIQKYNSSTKYRRLKTTQNLTDRNIKKIIFTVAGIMLVIQLIAGYLLEMTPVSDLKNLNKYALDFAQNGNFNLIQKDYQNNYAYLIRYPNNLALVFFLSFLYRLAYLNYGYVPMYIPIVVNALAINVSVLLTVFIARKIFGNRKALMVLILSFLFAPYYTYVSYYYTDSISMPFCVGAIYLFICAIKSDQRYKKYLMLVICGVLVFCGYKIKGSVILILAAAIIFLILKFKVKKTACLLLALIAGFGFVRTVYTTVYNSSEIITQKQSDKYEYPYTHWVMMGLKNNGSYDKEDDAYTRKFPDKNAKQEANIDEIKNRLTNYGIVGLAKHIAYKSVWTWEDGTYYISNHIKNPIRENFLHSIVIDKNEYQPIFFVYSSGFQLFLIFMICMSVLKGCIKPEINFQTFLRGIVFAVFIFFIIWETRSRYLYNFTPIFILLAVDGLDFFTEKIKPLKYFWEARNKKT